MRRFLWLLTILSACPAADYRVALPGYRYQFPRDHFNHPQYRSEWWYYTGNLRTSAGHRYGFELVFFRQGQPSQQSSQTPANASVWRVDDVYLAHLALTDIDGRRFRSWRRVNRAGPGIAGASFDEGRIWNGNWQVSWDKSSDTQTLTALAEGIRFTLRLVPRKPPVVHGENGVSQTGDGAGKASYYVSFTRLAVDGTLNGSPVAGTAWMDHEWFTTLLDAGQRGWDWFSLQLDNSTVHAVPDPPGRWQRRCALRRYVYRCRRPRHFAPPFRFRAPPRGLLDQPENWRAVPREVAHIGPIAETGSRLRRRLGRSGTGAARRLRTGLLGGRGFVLRRRAGRRLPGDDRLRAARAAVSV
jgi:hypothetical protein